MEAMIFLDPTFSLDPKIFYPKFFPSKTFFWNQKFWFEPNLFWTQHFFGPEIFLGPKIFFGPKIFSGPKFVLTQNNFWTHFFPPTKTVFGGRKQSFWTLSFLNWQRAMVLLKLEFDTEDQVLSYKFLFGQIICICLLPNCKVPS